MNEIDKFKQLVKTAQRILITSHISPDPDAVSSVLLLGTTLTHNYPDKEVVMAFEEEPEGLDFLAGYNDIKFGPLNDAVNGVKPDLLIMLDVVNYERCCRRNGQQIRGYLADNKVKTTIIDHHQPAGRDDSDIYINQGSISTTQDVYEVCFEHLKLKKPSGYGETTMLGIYSDSNGFTYSDSRHRDTFKIVSDLLDGGVDLESIKDRLKHYSNDQIRVLAELAKNITSQDDYSYSFLTNEFVQKCQSDSQSMPSLNTAAGIFVNEFIRNIDDRKWGFILYLNPLAGENTYSVSLRSRSDAKDVSKIANMLGGGGHKPAAGAKVEANSVEEALQKVQQAISSS